MKKALESIFILFLFFFSLVGIIAVIFGIREIYLDGKYSDLYINNCKNVKEGMTLEEAKVVMGGSNYHENGKSYSYWTSFKEGKPEKFTLEYPTSGASYHAVIHYDPITGLVTEVECSGY
jgi:hypothetical protein